MRIRRPPIWNISKNLEDAIESIRQGTREQYESGWTEIKASGDVDFTHELGEIPVVVDVIYSETSDGVSPAEVAATDVTVTKTITTINVTNNAASDYYFQVRAF